MRGHVPVFEEDRKAASDAKRKNKVHSGKKDKYSDSSEDEAEARRAKK